MKSIFNILGQLGLLLSIFISCSSLQGFDPKLLDYHYQPKRTSLFFSTTPSKSEATVNSCLQGKARACVDVAAKMIQEENEKGAFKFFELACNLDYGKGCYGAGNIEVGRKKLVSAESFYQKGCRYKFGPSCFSMAELDKKNNGDDEYKYEVYGHACDLRGDYGCVRLGELFYEEGNIELSKHYFHRSCALKNELGCYNLGFVYYKQGDLIKTLESLRLSCKYGQAEGCYQMARHYGHQQNDEYVFFYLNEAFKYNYTNWERIEFDRHFDFLRKRRAFRNLVDKFLLSTREKTLNPKSYHRIEEITPPKENKEDLVLEN